MTATSNPLNSATRIIAYNIDPRKLKVIGVNLKSKDGWLEDERIDLPLDPALVSNIKKHGVQKPIEVVIRDGNALVVDGRRRVRHAIEAGSKTVPIMVRREKDPLVVEFLAALGNAYRVEDSPISQARKTKRLLDLGMSQEQICDAHGWSPATFKNRMNLLSLAPKVVELVDDGKLSPIAALALRDFTPAKQEAKALRLIEEPEGQVKRAKAERKADKEGTAYVRPTLTYLKRLLETEAAANMDGAVFAALKWVIGEQPAESCPALDYAIQELGTATARPKKKKAPKRLSDLLKK